MSKKVKVAWGIDPFNSSEIVDKNTLTFLRELVKVSGLEVYPVYISSDAYAIYGRYPLLSDPLESSPYVTETVEKYLAGFNEISLHKFTIIENPSGLRSSEILRMTEFVQKWDCDYVLLGSQGRKGLQRMMMGSFTENFLLKSLVPVFVVNGKLKGHTNLSKALAPVEIDSQTKSFLETFLRRNKLSFIKNLNLFHNVNHRDFNQEDWAPVPLSTAHKNSMDILQEAKETSLAFLEDLIATQPSGVHLEASVEKYYGTLTDAVLKKGDQIEAGLIVLKSNTGSLSAKFFGSFAKVLIRDSHLPLLVFPVHHREKN